MPSDNYLADSFNLKGSCVTMNRFETGSSESLLRVSNVQKPAAQHKESVIDITDLGNKIELDDVVVHQLLEDTTDLFKPKESGLNQTESFNQNYVTEMDASDEEDTGDVAMLFSSDFVNLMSTNKKIKKMSTTINISRYAN